MGSPLVPMGPATLHYLLHRDVLDIAYHTYSEKNAKTIIERNVPF